MKQNQVVKWLTVLSLMLAALAFAARARAEDFFDALYLRDLDEIKALVKENPDIVNSIQPLFERPALVVAVDAGKKDVVAFLLDSGAKINGVSRTGITALQWAALYGKDDIARFLWDKGAEPDIYSAAALGKTAAVEKLLAANPRLLKAPARNDLTPVQLAANHGQCDVVRFLAAHGADPTAPNSRAETPLHFAARRGDQAMVALLLELHADPNRPNRIRQTPLHVAARYGNKETVALLLKAHADVRAVDWLGHTPLHLAALGNKKDNAVLLLANGADVDAVSDDGTPLHMLISASANPEFVKLLLDHHPNLQLKDRQERTPLAVAEIFRRRAIIELLVAHGAKPSGQSTPVSSPVPPLPVSPSGE